MKKKIGLLIVSVITVISMVGVVSAQDQTPPLAPDRGLRSAADGEPILRQLLQIVADDLGVQPVDILQQLRGNTLAEVIAANGGSVEAISAEVIAAITERVNQAVVDQQLTQERADQILGGLEEAVQRALQGEGLRRPRPREELRSALLGNTRPLFSAAADATGLTAQEIVQAMRDGKTLAEVITEQGGSPDTVVADAVAKVKETLDQAVTNGRLTQEQEDAMLNGLKAFYDAVMNGSFRPQVDATV